MVRLAQAGYVWIECLRFIQTLPPKDMILDVPLPIGVCVIFLHLKLHFHYVPSLKVFYARPGNPGTRLVISTIPERETLPPALLEERNSMLP